MSADHQRAFDDVQALWGKLGELPYLPKAPDKTALRADRYTGDVRIRQWRARPAMRPAARRWAWAAAASVLVAIGGGIGAWQYWQYGLPMPTTYQTVTGQHQTVRLPDGSEMELGAASAAEVHYADNERGIELVSGVAYFDVVRNPQQPFVVRAGGGSVTAIGTAFTVQRRGTDVTVIVSDGLVEVAKPVPAARAPVVDVNRQPAVVQLPAGQQVAFSSDEGLALPEATDVAAATAWRDGRLVFQDESLAAAIADVNRYSRIRIELANAQLAELRLTGTVVTSQVDGWLKGLESVLPVTVTQYPDRIVLSQRGVAPPE
jgi:transmembrane sensor